MKYKVVGIKNDSELIWFATKKEAIEWVDKLLDVMNFSLLNALNEIQGACKVQIKVEGVNQVIECFPDKFEIPLFLINLVLKEYGIRIDAK